MQAQLGAVEVEVLTGDTGPAASLANGAEQLAAPAASAAVSLAAARRDAASASTASSACAMHKWLTSNGAGNGASLAADGGSGGGGGGGSGGSGGGGGSSGGPASPWARGASAEGIFAAAPFSSNEWVALQVSLQPSH